MARFLLDYMSQLATAANTSFPDEGFTFTSMGSDRSYTMTFTPTGGRTVTFSGASVTQAFGGPVSASGEPSNMDGLTFESMEDVLPSSTHSLRRWRLRWSLHTPGALIHSTSWLLRTADASSTIALSGDDLVELGFTGGQVSIGGGVDRAEEVRCCRR